MSEQSVHVKRNINWLSLLERQKNEFCLSTCLHGFRQMVNVKRTRTERVLWGLVVLASFICAIILMHIAWEYNSSRPTITVIESTHRGIWFYPFPAITICNINRLSLRRTTAMVQNLIIPDDLTTEYVINEMKLLLELLEPGKFGEDIAKNLSRLQDIIDDNNLIITNVLKLVAPNCSDLIQNCKWKGRAMACSELFEDTVSRDGFGCSFNYIFSPNNTVRRIKRPRRVNACGYQTGLTLLLNPEPDDYLGTLIGSYGSKIILHYSYDYPDQNTEVKYIGMGNQVFLSISPEEIYSTPEIMNLPIERRKCIFSSERKLIDPTGNVVSNLTYARYSYINCVTECRATTIKAKCQCIPYYYQQTGTRICTLRDVECMKEFKYWYDTALPGINTLDNESLTAISDYPGPCECLPDCALYRYPVEGSQGVLNASNSLDVDDSFKTVDTQNQSMVHIFFSDLVSIQYRRSVYYDWRNLVASFGGLMGLFAGFSLMSGFELIYFFIIRVITDVRTI